MDPIRNNKSLVSSRQKSKRTKINDLCILKPKINLCQETINLGHKGKKKYFLCLLAKEKRSGLGKYTPTLLPKKRNKQIFQDVANHL
jgi:hypothetical protein